MERAVDLKRHLLYRAFLNRLFPDEAETLMDTAARILSQYNLRPQEFLYVYNTLVKLGLIYQSEDIDKEALSKCIEAKQQQQAHSRGRHKELKTIIRECKGELGYKVKYEITEPGIIEYCSDPQFQEYVLKPYQLKEIEVDPRVEAILLKCLEYSHPGG